MKKMKKILALVLAMALMASLAACGSSGSPAGGTAEEKTEEKTEASAPEAEDAAGDVIESTAEAAVTTDTGAAAAETAVSFDKLVFGTNAEFPPFEFVNSAGGAVGEFDGIDMAIVKQIGEDLGVEVSINNMEFDSLLIALANGQIDATIAGMTVTEERKKSVNFTIPYYTATQVMIVRQDSDIQKATDMADKQIRVIQGYTGEVCVKKLGYPYESFKKGTEAILELKNKKCDVVVIDSATAQKYVSDNPELKIVEDPGEFESEEYAIAVRKDNTELLDVLNAEIEKMLADNKIAEYAAQYAVSSEE